MHTQSITLRDGSLSGELRYNRPTEQLIIVCHGYKSSRHHRALTAITQGLVERGYAAFNFNFSDTTGFDVPAQVADIALIVSHFKHEYSGITLLAGSFGALSAAIAAKSPDISGLITINGFFGSPSLGPKFKPSYTAFRLFAFVSKRHRTIWKYFRRELAPGQLTVPVLMVHSESDEMVFIQQSEDFFDRVTSSKRFLRLKSADHNLSSPADTVIIVSEIDSWMQGVTL